MAMDWLLNWMWQGLALAFVVKLVVHRLPSTSAATRFTIWWVTFTGVLTIPVLPRLLGSFAGSTPSPSEATSVSESPAAGLHLPAPPDWLVAIAIGAWLGGVLIKLTQLVLSARRLAELKSRCQALPSALAGRLSVTLRDSARRRAVTLAITDDLGVPALLGFWRPVVAIPRSLTQRLSADDVDFVVRHELAHAERRDDWLRLVQRVIESFYCFHPAVWLIGRRLDDERELACDDRVIAERSQRRSYAACLTRVAEYCTDHRAPLLTPAALGSRSQMAKRVERLLTTDGDAGRGQSLAATASGTLFVAAALVACAVAPPVLRIASEPAAPAIVLAIDRSTAKDEATAVAPTTVDAFRETLVQNATVSVRAASPRDANRRVRQTRITRASRPDTKPYGSTARVADILPAARSREIEEHAAVQHEAAAAGPVLVASVALPSGPLLIGTPDVRAKTLRPIVAAPASLPRAPADLAPWNTVADAGVAIGGGAKRAGLATGRFFSHLGSNIARSF